MSGDQEPQGAENRRYPRYILPKELVGVLYILDQDKQIIFEAPIRDISFSGLGLESEKSASMRQLLGTLRTTKELRFENAIVVIGDFKVATGVHWMWSTDDGKSGIEFLNMSMGYQDRLKNFLEKLKKEGAKD